MYYLSTTGGDLPTIELLWKLAGPTSPGRATWFEGYSNSFINCAIKNGHTLVLDWISHAAHTLRVPIDWAGRAWDDAATAGRLEVIHWGIAQGHVKQLECSAALISARGGDTSIIEWWITTQPDQEAVMAALNDGDALVDATDKGSVAGLDWWWAYTADTPRS
ncbi:hypothetical protein BC828DRAFT_409355 [Blastocladiella britannica]|nr:hypothetical protein BC828DRAFT_409355 [Blastocladiella britannica]